MENSSAIEERLKLERSFKSGANWFFWIAGLSIINSVIIIAGGQWNFIVGLGITQVIDAIAHEIGSAGIGVALVLDILVAGVFVLFGIFARKKYLWAFIIGMILYTLDGLLFLLAGDWLGIAFHILVLFFIFGGISALKKLNQMGKEQDKTANTSVA